MFGPRVSSAKWIAARLLFESAGIDVDPADDAHTEILARAEIGGLFRTTRTDYLEGLHPQRSSPPSAGSSTPP